MNLEYYLLKRNLFIAQIKFVIISANKIFKKMKKTTSVFTPSVPHTHTYVNYTCPSANSLARMKEFFFKHFFLNIYKFSLLVNIIKFNIESCFYVGIIFIPTLYFKEKLNLLIWYHQVSNSKSPNHKNRFLFDFLTALNNNYF